ncbi:MAG: EAL domain-containing protein [Deltaproteobacteria bacterium]|nr:MAG: EAL domain-containing protein [Deltaproteobacteria bacterium]
MSSTPLPGPSDAPKRSTESAAAEKRIARLGEVLRDVEARFDTEHALGVMVVDAGPLASIEESYGSAAHQRVLALLAVEIRVAIGGHLGLDDLVVTGETGRSEAIVILFRSIDEGNFYGGELPGLRRAIGARLEGRGNRIVYPFLRSAPELFVGIAPAIRNPNLGAVTQLRRAIDEARRDAQLDARIAARRRREQFVKLILEGQVTSVYEPIVEVTTRTVFGYEALARGPEGSDLHSPLVMFSGAEQEDLVFQLDCLCRRSGLAGALHLPAGTKLFLNMRPTAIHDPSFQPEALCRTLERTQLSPSDLVFEISEQESIENFSMFREVRDFYGNLGFQIALDDTGAGYASLEAVMELSPEFIKVDRAFVSGIDEDPARKELLRALSTVAESIGAQIIGEGLDTLEELSTLGELGVRYGQGWLFGKPMPLGMRR